jgi:uncharacterized membrane protein
MAGIGFSLKKLSQKDNISGTFFAYTHAALASSGPWLFTILALAGIFMLGEQITTRQVLYEFRLIVIYNFSFSLVLTGPIAIIATRYLADGLYKEDVSTARGMLIGYLTMAFLLQLPLVIWLYGYLAELSGIMIISAVINYMLISAIWITTIFLTALKDYRTITLTFAAGAALSMLTTYYMAKDYGTAGMLNGFSLGLALILASIVAKIIAEYPVRICYPQNFVSYIKKYWELVLAALFYNLAIWVDKWIMWFVPEADVGESGLRFYTQYDSAMFIAYLSFVPGMALFIFAIETQFFEKYLKFFRDIKAGANFQKIQNNHRTLINTILENGRNFMVLQLSICVFLILTAPQIFEAFNLSFVQISIYRYGLLGATFHLFALTLMILLSYFDHRKAILYINLAFLLMNIIFTIISAQMGFTYYGFGYFVASLITFVISAITLARYVIKLPYHTFITRNLSVK